jgi:hypothetical protein
MAIIELNPLFKEIHGKMGDVVFRRGLNGKTILSRAPHKKRKKSQKAQKAQKEQNARQQQRMLAAHEYAHFAMKDPVLRASYEKEAARTRSKAYWLALGDFLKTERKPGE